MRLDQVKAVPFLLLRLLEAEVEHDHPTRIVPLVIRELVGPLDGRQLVVLGAGEAKLLLVEKRQLVEVGESLVRVVQHVLEIVQEIDPFDRALAAAPFHRAVEGERKGLVPVQDAKILVQHVHGNRRVGPRNDRHVGRVSEGVEGGRVGRGRRVVLGVRLPPLLHFGGKHFRLDPFDLKERDVDPRLVDLHVLEEGHAEGEVNSEDVEQATQDGKDVDGGHVRRRF